MLWVHERLEAKYCCFDTFLIIQSLLLCVELRGLGTDISCSRCFYSSLLLQVRPVHRQVAAHLRRVARHRPARPHGGALSRPGSVSQSLGNIINVYHFPPKKLLTSFDFSLQSSRAIGRRKPCKETLHIPRFLKIHKNDYVCA